MSRVSDADLDQLDRFLAEYRVPPSLGAQARASLLKRVHRHVLAGLQVQACFLASARAGTSTISGTIVDPSSESVSHLNEGFADLVGVLGCLVHGLYKPSNMLLRGSVENFVRGLAGLSSLEARETKSVYRLFELAAKEPPFLAASVNDFLSLQQVYGDLCLHVHSATPDHRGGAHHLSVYMRQDTAKMRSVVLAVERASRAMLSILVRSDRRLYTGCSPRVRDLLDEVLPSGVRLVALGATSHL